MSRLEDLDGFRNMLRINKHRLDDELEIQAEVLDRISQQATKADRRVAELKERLAAVEGRLRLDLKAEEPKITVAEMDAQLQKDKERSSAWMELRGAVDAKLDWDGLYEAWKQRGKDIKELSSLYSAQYWSVDSTYSKDRSNYDSLRNRASAAREPEQPPSRERRRV